MEQEPSLMNKIQSEISNVGEMVKESTSNITNKVGEITDSTKSVFDNGVDSVKSVLPPAPIPADGNSFSLADYTTMSSEFLESNSYVARAAFILLVVFVFFVLLRVATALIKYFIDRKSMPIKLIDGMHDGANVLGPLSQGFGSSYTIPRSSNEENGIEFTWAVSLYIKDHPQTSTKQIRHVFSKGSIPTFTGTTGGNEQTGITTINQAPGLYFDSIGNKLIIKMDTFNNGTSTINIETIPHNKWLNVLIRCKQTLIDVYINGQIAKSTVLPSTPKQNYGSVYISESGGFVGSISNLFYYNYALSINEIQKLLEDSVNTQLTANDGINDKKVDYLGFKWYV
jgi:hypothetical protein